MRVLFLGRIYHSEFSTRIGDFINVNGSGDTRAQRIVKVHSINGRYWFEFEDGSSHTLRGQLGTTKAGDYVSLYSEAIGKPITDATKIGTLVFNGKTLDVHSIDDCIFYIYENAVRPMLKIASEHPNVISNAGAIYDVDFLDALTSDVVKVTLTKQSPLHDWCARFLNIIRFRSIL